MKQFICYWLVLFGTLTCEVGRTAGPTADVAGQPTSEQLQILQTKAEQIVKKCVAKAMLIREERVCEAKKNAIFACLMDETKSKDLERAYQICERNYIL